MRDTDIAVVLVVAMLAGCSAPATRTRDAGAQPRAGTIVAVRAIVPAPDVIRILASRAPDALPAPSICREFILRGADGRIVSVVQPDDPALRPGQPARLSGEAPSLLSAGD